MVKVIKANACYTGGGIYIYTGRFDDGTFFMTDTTYLDYVMVLDTDPEENWDDNCYDDWQNEHMLCEYEGTDAEKIVKAALKYIIKHEPDGNYMVSEIERELDSLR